MISLISISVALLVVVAGLMLLAKTKKEELGGVFTFASYAVTTIGLIVLAVAFVVGICNMCSRGGECCGKVGKAGCYASSCSHYGSQSYWKQGCAKQSCAKQGCSKNSRCSRSCCVKAGSSKPGYTGVKEDSTDVDFEGMIITGEKGGLNVEIKTGKGK